MEYWFYLRCAFGGGKQPAAQLLQGRFRFGCTAWQIVWVCDEARKANCCALVCRRWGTISAFMPPPVQSPPPLPQTGQRKRNIRCSPRPMLYSAITIQGTNTAQTTHPFRRICWQHWCMITSAHRKHCGATSFWIYMRIALSSARITIFIPRAAMRKRKTNISSCMSCWRMMIWWGNNIWQKDFYHRSKSRNKNRKLRTFWLNTKSEGSFSFEPCFWQKLLTLQ